MTYGATGGIVDSSSLSDNPYVFPTFDGQQLLALKTPVWPEPIISKSATGREIRGSFASVPTWKFKVSYDFLQDNSVSDSELQQLFAFFCLRYGQYGSFYFNDTRDNTVPETQFGTGDGDTTTFQLLRDVACGTT